ncbi:MAG: hypothetical protein GY906_05245 [bacterium]|nr:hypothetical protein [bacterium]
MGQKVFVVDKNKNLSSLEESAYDSEDLLQELLARYPDLLSSEADVRWLLTERERAVPDEEGGSGRWSLDHLFLDSEGVPTLVEVKRSSDTRLRREVVGQMLDYAANGVAYWPVQDIRSAFEKRCDKESLNSEAELEQLIGPDEDPERFWQQVKTNLQAGRIRMVFVADIIPSELQRVVEFLNEQMDPAEVLAVEVKQFVGEGIQTLIPRVVGRTVEAERRKSTGRRPNLTEDQLLAHLEDPSLRATIQDIFAAVKSAGGIINVGSKGASIRVPVESQSEPVSIAWVNPPGEAGWMGLTDLVLGFGKGDTKPFDLPERPVLERYVEAVSAIEGVTPAKPAGIFGYTVSSDRTPALKDEIIESMRRVIAELRGDG